MTFGSCSAKLMPAMPAMPALKSQGAPLPLEAGVTIRDADKASDYDVS